MVEQTDKEKEEERERTLAWLSRYGQKIAGGMFRDAGLFSEEEELKKGQKGKESKESSS